MTTLQLGDIVSIKLSADPEDEVVGTVYWITRVSEEEYIAWAKWRTDTRHGSGSFATTDLTLIESPTAVTEPTFTLAQVGRIVEQLASDYWVPATTRLGMLDPYPHQEIAHLSGAWASMVVNHLAE